jgi:transposase-like protein/predicted phosphodiesterase
MTARKHSDAALIAAVRAGIAKKCSGAEIARSCGYTSQTALRNRWERIRRERPALPDLPDHASGIEARERRHVTNSAARAVELEKEVKRLRANSDIRRRLFDLIHDCKQVPRDPPKWLTERKCSNARWHHGTPTLFLSDLHWGERVFKAQVNGVNEYDLDIAHRRLKTVCDTSIVLLRDVLSKGDYDGIVVPLGGDMCSGNIHEELRETNSLPINACVLGLLDHLIATIDKLKKEFGTVYVPCVTGNHGRLDKKPRAKNAVYDNFEWILYQFLARHYAKDEKVTVHVADSSDIVYSVQGRRFLLTHGDQFHGGSGVSGPWTPWALGDSRKRSRQQAVGSPFDTMIFGHWHTLTWGPGDRWIVNGSLKGYDEYAFRQNFGFERPQQALFVTHPKNGITFRMGVQADD